MKALWLSVIVAVGVVGTTTGASESPTLEVISPTPETVASGRTRIAVSVEPSSAVREIAFFADGRLACTVERQPFVCWWDAGPVVRGHHLRVVAKLKDGGRLVRNVRTKDLGYTELADAEAVLVPVIVTRHGQFVSGLKREDFRVLENGVPQSIASFISEDAPLDLVVAVDISGSMEEPLPQVKSSVRQLLSKLRPDDAATLLGFNDTMFIVAERETDARTREAAVELLTSFGGTALYDATLRALDLVGPKWGRKGVVIFTDGDDRNSLATRGSVLDRVEASEAMLYTVGFGSGVWNPFLKESLETYARSTGGRAFFPSHIKDLDAAFERIVEELSHQYVLSYSSANTARDGTWRDIEVQLRERGYDVRARRGYRAARPRQARR